MIDGLLHTGTLARLRYLAEVFLAPEHATLIVDVLYRISFHSPSAVRHIIEVLPYTHYKSSSIEFDYTSNKAVIVPTTAANSTRPGVIFIQYAFAI